ncbi:MAG TPA: hypothetical protein VGB68_14565 [Pyrinomonadaceae bacterium]|jgi:hypothetical protein
MIRSEPTSLSCEPTYPNETDLVMFSIRFPDWTGHLKHKDCEKECPHKIEDCGLWKDK